jgi:arabinofuranan 3-O-arabinosyltransferase
LEGRVLRQWLLKASAVAAIAGVAVQSWFRSGTTIATGDITPPVGTAWVTKVFEPWIWSGSNLGGPTQITPELPWAVVAWIGQLLGGSPELGQRLWFTGLFMGAALGIFALLAVLRLGPAAAAIGAAVYLLNPYVISIVEINPVYIAALGLLAGMPAVLLAAGMGRIPVRLGVTLIAIAAPMFGFVNLNPPLLGMVLAAMLATPLLAAWLEGKEVALRSLQTLGTAIPLLLLVSLYWIVPMVLSNPIGAAAQLASAASWSWTESRSTLGNAFWLNTSWAWAFPEYYSFARAYDAWPLSILKFVLPTVAFSALALGRATNGTGGSDRGRAIRLAVAAATAAIIVILLSTGTKPPGNFVFNVLYALPLGWLLREPGRFLMVAGLAYAVLVAVIVDEVGRLNAPAVLKRWDREVLRARRYFVGPLILAMMLALGFPLYTGAFVPDSRPLLPAAHVKVPAYWTEMARYVDALPTQGAVLVMPPNDFYQMPYSWGYYGSDGFVFELFHRAVLSANAQSYSPTSAELQKAIDLTAQSILAGDWQEVQALMDALHTPFVLVRGDIESSFPDRAIIPPNDLAAALAKAPNLSLIRTVGSLDLFQLTTSVSESEVVSDFITVNSRAPDLRLLSVLRPGTVMVSSPPLAGTPSAVQAPPLEQWNSRGDTFEWSPISPPGSQYEVVELTGKSVLALVKPGEVTMKGLPTRVVYAPAATDHSVTVSIPGKSIISNGDFAAGSWGVRNCHGLNANQHGPDVQATVVRNGAPGGLPSLQLTSSVDSACVTQPLQWAGGAVVVDLLVHPIEGAAPRVCLWEEGPNRCAILPPIPTGPGWSTYRASVTPDAGTSALSINLFADATNRGGRTVAEYASVRVVGMSILPSLVLLAKPENPALSDLRLAVVHNSFSTNWGATVGNHVLVDGMLNGWLLRSPSDRFMASYMPATTVRIAQWISAVTGLIVLLIPWWVPLSRGLVNRVRGHPSKP